MDFSKILIDADIGKWFVYIVAIIIGIASYVAEKREKSKRSPNSEAEKTPTPELDGLDDDFLYDSEPQYTQTPAQTDRYAGHTTPSRKTAAKTKVAYKKPKPVSPYARTDTAAFNTAAVHTNMEADSQNNNILTSLARDGIVWSEILQPPVSVRG